MSLLLLVWTISMSGAQKPRPVFKYDWSVFPYCTILEPAGGKKSTKPTIVTIYTVYDIKLSNGNKIREMGNYK